MDSRYTRVRKGPFTCATYQDGTQWIYARVYYEHHEHTLGRYPTHDDAQRAYDEFSLQQALQRFPELTPEQQRLLEQTITAHPPVAEPLARMLRNRRPIELGHDFRHRTPSSPTRHTSVSTPIRGIPKVFVKNGDPRWLLTLTHNHDVSCRRFSSLQDAEDYYLKAQVQPALAAFPSLTDDQMRELTALQKEAYFLVSTTPVVRISSLCLYVDTSPFGLKRDIQSAGASFLFEPSSIGSFDRSPSWIPTRCYRCEPALVSRAC